MNRIAYFIALLLCPAAAFCADSPVVELFEDDTAALIPLLTMGRPRRQRRRQCCRGEGRRLYWQGSSCASRLIRDSIRPQGLGFSDRGEAEGGRIPLPSLRMEESRRRADHASVPHPWPQARLVHPLLHGAELHFRGNRRSFQRRLPPTGSLSPATCSWISVHSHWADRLSPLEGGDGLFDTCYWAEPSKILTRDREDHSQDACEATKGSSPSPTLD